MGKPEEHTVLVVDDEPNVRDYLAQILRDAGFRVRTAGDGVEALAMIRAEPPDFISLDLVMPRKSGHKLMYELRKDPALARIPVVIVTAHAQDEFGQEPLRDIMANRVISGPGTYLEKPVRPQDYVRCVQRALGLEESPPDEAETRAERTDLLAALGQQVAGAEAHALRRALAALRQPEAPREP